MKKRLLITSIVMMLVVAVALSTATYAWFTSNTQVTANQVILTASTMNADAILISRSADNTGLSQEITLASAGSDLLYPATPNDADAFTTTLSASNFKNLLVDGSNTAKNQTLTGNDKSYYTDTFYVYNKGFSAVTLAPVVTIYYDESDGASYDAARSVRIAIIEKVGTAVSSSNVTLGSAVLKNIYEFDADHKGVNYVQPTSYADVTYYKNANGDAWDGDTITSENFETNKANLWVADKNKSTAKNGALGTYGATASSGDAFVQGSITYTAAGFSAIAAPASGTYVANEYTVVVWLEGWDAQCTNAMSAGLFRIDLKFSKAA